MTCSRVSGLVYAILSPGDLKDDTVIVASRLRRDRKIDYAYGKFYGKMDKYADVYIDLSA